MKKKRILAMILAVASCLSLAVSASAANPVNRKATDFRDYDRTAWYAEAVSAAVDNGLLYGKSATVIDPNGDMTRAEMAAIINRSFGCYKTADISQYKDVSKDKWYYKDVAMAVQMGTYNGRSSSTMAPDSPITRQEAMTVWSEDVISLNKKISDILSQVQFLTQLQQAGGVDPDTFISSNNKLSEQLRRLKQEKARLLDTGSDDLADRTRDLMDALEDGPDFLDGFDAELFDALVDKIIVDSNERLRFRLKNGLELLEQIERTRR